MQAIEISGDTFRATERPTPAPRAGEVLIRVHAAGMNRADRLQIKGLHPPPPGASDIPGLEVAGTIESAGNGVSRWKPGDAVCALLPGGGYAEYAVAHADLCLPVPDGFTMVQAGALPEAAFTVWNNVFLRGQLKAGETLLVHGGTSGIGTLAIQMAKALGAKVLATTGSADKAEFCEKLGADRAVDRNAADFTQVFKDTPPDVVLDMAGGGTLARDLQLMAPDGRHVSIAYLEGRESTIDLALVMKKRLVITGSTLRGRSLPEHVALAKALEAHIWPHLDKTITPVVDRVFPLAQAAEALEYFASGSHAGKVVLKV